MGYENGVNDWHLGSRKAVLRRYRRYQPSLAVNRPSNYYHATLVCLDRQLASLFITVIRA